MDLTVPIQPIVMRPPNLKIWAERDYTVQEGMTKDENRRYTIGSEGAALTSDTTVTLYTQWLDHDGSPLPEGLGVDHGEHFGYTGRLAKIVSPSKLAGASQSDLALFAIAPGRHTQVVKVKSNLSTPEHYYIHVSGTPKDCNGDNYCPDFGTNGTAPPPYNTRPTHITPFLVPLYDEDKSLTETSAWRQLKQQQQENDDEDAIKQPLPAYAWQYRPEYQFSQYELAMQAINRIQNPGEPEEEITNLLEQEEPILANGVDLIEVLYSLISSKFERLTAIDGKQELVFALGEDETRVTLGEDQTISFDNLDHMGSLDAEDFLTLRLYTNNDAGNILWEWAFEFLSVFTPQEVEIDTVFEQNSTEREVIYLSADDPELDIQALLFGFAAKEPGKKIPKTIQWVVEGSGSMIPAASVSPDSGLFKSHLTMPRVAGTRGIVTAELMSADGIKAHFTEVEVIPGKPHRISLSTEGFVSAMAATSMKVQVEVRDAYNNLVSDGTLVSFSVTGDAQLVEIKNTTKNGQVSVSVIGTEFSSNTNQLQIKVGELGTLVKTHDFIVHPLNITLDSFSTNQVAGSTVPVTFQVTDKNNQPVAAIGVSLSSSYGIFQKGLVITNSSGFATTNLINPPSARAAVLNARVGFAAGLQLNYSIVSGGVNDPELDTQDGMVIGDRTSDGHLPYTRFDGVSMQFDYKTHTPIRLSADPDQLISVTLGDRIDPNLAPMAAYYMNGLDTTEVGHTRARDETGQHHARAVDISVVADSANHVADSYQFEAGSYLDIPRISAYNKAQNIGFRLEFKAVALDAVLLDHNNGTQRLRYRSDGRLSYQITTTDGIFTVISEPMMNQQWHHVAGRYYQGQLELQVGEQLFQIAASGDLIYPDGGNEGIRIGDGYQGYLNSVRFYDWDSEPLLKLPNATSRQIVRIDSSGHIELEVSSTGHLNTLQNGSQLSNLKVAVRTDSSRQFLSVISSSAYVKLAALYMQNGYHSPPPYQFAGGGAPVMASQLALNTLNFIITPAHAGWLDDIYEGVKSTVGFFIPYEAFLRVVEQLGFLASGSDQFDPMELAFSAVEVLTVIPMAKPLKPMLKPIKEFFLKYGNKPIVKALGGVLGSIAEDAVKRRKFDKLFSLVPYLLIVAEIALDDEARGALTVMVDSISSSDDLWSWINYFNLPADGWDEDGVPPALALTKPAPDNHWLDSLISPAYAIKNPTKRADGGVLGKTVTSVFKNTKNIENLKPGDFSDALKNIRQGLINTPYPKLRGLAFSPQLLRSSLSVLSVKGASAVRKMITGQSSRISPLVMMAVVTYLETRMDPKECKDIKDIPECKELDPVLHSAIRTKYALAFGELFVNGKIPNTLIGAQFHLVMIAVQHLAYEVKNEGKIKDIELYQQIQIWNRDRSGTVKKTGVKLGRYVDIVIQGSGKDSKPFWIETKSLQSTGFSKHYAPWSYPRSVVEKISKIAKNPYRSEKGLAHKQFLQDRIAATNNELILNKPLRKKTQLSSGFNGGY